MGPLRFIATPPFALAALCSASPALARPSVDAEPQLPEVGSRGVEIGASSGAGAGSTAGFVFAGISAGYRVLPALSLGAYAQSSLATFALGQDGCDAGESCDLAGFGRFGARGELHWVPDFVVDPWAGLGAGALLFRGDLRAEVVVEGGVDVHPSPGTAVGVFMAFSPDSGARSWAGTTAVGARLVLSFDAARAGQSAGRAARRF